MNIKFNKGFYIALSALGLFSPLQVDGAYAFSSEVGFKTHSDGFFVQEIDYHRKIYTGKNCQKRFGNYSPEKVRFYADNLSLPKGKYLVRLANLTRKKQTVESYSEKKNHSGKISMRDIGPREGKNQYKYEIVNKKTKEVVASDSFSIVGSFSSSTNDFPGSWIKESTKTETKLIEFERLKCPWGTTNITRNRVETALRDPSLENVSGNYGGNTIIVPGLGLGTTIVQQATQPAGGQYLRLKNVGRFSNNYYMFDKPDEISEAQMYKAGASWINSPKACSIDYSVCTKLGGFYYSQEEFLYFPY